LPICVHARGIEAATVVLDDEAYRFGSSDEADGCASGPGVARDVGQGLLADPVEGNLDAWRERAGRGSRRETRGDARLGSQRSTRAFSASGRERFSRGEARRSRTARRASSRLDWVRERARSEGGADPLGVRVRFEEGLGRLDLEPRGGQVLGEGVVDLARQPVALLDGT
jgi:hypothetical protein